MLNTVNLKQAVSRRLAGTRAYVPLRTIYQFIFNRKCARIRSKRRVFFGEFVKPGVLVFDVGANVGEYSDTFLQLGARVLAIEPNPECCTRIRALGRKRRLTVRCEALSDHQGESNLFIGVDSGLSTVSPEWMETAAHNDAGYQWKETIITHLNTLDQLQSKYGTPEFIKIDVEGYEESVLRGMSFRPSALAFEFHAFAWNQASVCLHLPIFDSGCTFNITLGDTFQLIWPDWQDKKSVIDYVSRLSPEVFGDICVRFASA